MIIKICENCGKEFQVYKSRGDEARFCSKKCWYDYKREHDKVSYKNCICSFCGKEFEVPAYWPGKYCSENCYHLSRRNREIRICKNCGKEFEIKKSVYMNCCSMKCRLEYQKKHKVDRSFYRTKEWKKIRMKVLVRDDFKCQDCGEDVLELHVHHKIPVRNGGDDSIDNLITLCYGCHQKYHNKKPHWF